MTEIARNDAGKAKEKKQKENPSYRIFPGRIIAMERKRPSKRGESFCIIDSVPLAR